MMEIHECVVCGVSIWLTEGYLCLGHRTIRGQMALDTRVMAAVRRIERTYFALGDQHPAHQLANRRAHGHWVMQFDDMMRQAIYWLASGDESEAA